MLAADTARIGRGEEQISQFGFQDKTISRNDGEEKYVAHPNSTMLRHADDDATKGVWLDEIETLHGGNWDVEPDVDRVVNGIPLRVDRIRGLGNSVVPQCAQEAFRRLRYGLRTLPPQIANERPQGNDQHTPQSRIDDL